MTINLYMVFSIISFLLFLWIFFSYLKQKKSLELLKDDNSDANECIKNLELQYAVLQTRYEEEIKASQQKLSVLQHAKDELSN